MDKESSYNSTILYLELLFIISLLLSPLAESIKALFASSLEYTEIMSGAANPSLFATLIQGLFALGMFIRIRTTKIAPSRLIFFYFLMIVFLVVNSIFWNWIIHVQGGEALKLQEIKIQNPILFIIATSTAAFYEEMVYRWYGPRIFTLVFLKNTGEEGVQQIKNKKIKSILIEVFFVVIFALSHGYGGWEAVGNALIAGFALRLCILKTGSPLPSFFAHLSYNFIQFYLLLQ